MTVAKYESMEKAILEVAERLFLEKGFAMTSTTEIAREAGCNQALIHYYFRTKENLFRKVFEQKINLFASVFFSIDEQGGTFEQKLSHKIGAHFDILLKNPKLPFLIINEITTNPSRITALKEQAGKLPEAIILKLETELKHEIAAGRIRPMSVLDLILNILSLNIMMFLLKPIVQTVTVLSETELDELIRHRKAKNIETILRSLRP